jgi:hypothetical protein
MVRQSKVEVKRKNQCEFEDDEFPAWPGLASHPSGPPPGHAAGSTAQGHGARCVCVCVDKGRNKDGGLFVV